MLMTFLLRANMNKSTAYKLMQSPNFLRTKIGGRYYISEENLLKFLKQNIGRDVPLHKMDVKRLHNHYREIVTKYK